MILVADHQLDNTQVRSKEGHKKQQERLKVGLVQGMA